MDPDDGKGGSPGGAGGIHIIELADLGGDAFGERAIWGMKTTVRETSAFVRPEPSAPDRATASSTEGKA